MWRTTLLVFVLLVHPFSFKKGINDIIHGEEGVLLSKGELLTNPSITDDGFLILTFVHPFFAEGRLGVCVA